MQVVQLQDHIRQRPMEPRRRPIVGSRSTVPTDAAAMAGTVLVVDDVPRNVALLRSLLEREGYKVVEAANGTEALAAIDRASPDVILLDVMMPDVDGFEVCRQVKERRETRLIPVVLLTASAEGDAKLQGINAGADDFLTKPFNVHELSARVRSLVRLKRFTDDLDSAQSVIISLALTIEARDKSTDGHCQRLAHYATEFGVHLGLDENDITALHQGGFLHDVGKVGVPDAVLMKRGPLTRREFDCMKQHPIVGDRVCSGLRSLQRVRPIVRSHHERLDGSGYPDGLRGDQVPFLAQIMSLVDVFDALTSARPYKRPLSAEHAFAELEREAQKGWRQRELVLEFAALAARRSVLKFRDSNPRLPGS